MDAGAVIEELDARGLNLTRDDLTAYLLDYFKPSDCNADEIAWNRKHIEGALAYALENSLGTPSTPSPGVRPVVSVAEMLGRLRSKDIATRVIVGSILGHQSGGALGHWRTPGRRSIPVGSPD